MLPSDARLDNLRLETQFVASYFNDDMNTFAQLAASNPSYLTRKRVDILHVLYQTCFRFIDRSNVMYMSCLIHHGANVNVLVFSHNDIGGITQRTLLGVTLVMNEKNTQERLNVVRMLLNAGAAPNPPPATDDDIPYLVHVLSSDSCPGCGGCHCYALFDLLLKAGADLEACRRYIMTHNGDVPTKPCMSVFNLLPARRLAAQRACILLLAKTRTLIPQRDVRVMLARMVWERRWDEEWDVNSASNKK